MVLPTKNKGKEKKIGHRRVNKNTGEVTYKKTTSTSISGAIQLGIAHSVGQLSREPERDILLGFINFIKIFLFIYYKNMFLRTIVNSQNFSKINMNHFESKVNPESDARFRGYRNCDFPIGRYYTDAAAWSRRFCLPELRATRHEIFPRHFWYLCRRLPQFNSRRAFR